jgi:uncharacterized protein Yka (UPF0111/DUF47 family)
VRRSVRRLATVLAVCAASAVAVACGDDGMSVSEYRTEARQICTEADRATQRIRQPTRTTPAAIADYFERLLAPNERATERFEALEPPDELQEAHDAAVRANRRGSEEVRRLIEQLEGGEDPRQALAGAQDRIRSLTREADAAAERLGVPECGE